ncbi:MAG: hypothetical protein LBJ18_01945 [Rickettsiales bacterium]|jgi:hypothetical protein|nr:hypothetical protein [Rickettsiales bacterium]
MNSVKLKIFVKKISRLFICPLFIVHCSLFIAPAFAETPSLWENPASQTLFVNNLTDDIKSFGAGSQTTLVKDYVPTEAKVGRALIGGLSMVSLVLERSLVSFIDVFLMILFAFWLMLEGYNFARAGTNDWRKLAESIAKKAVLIIVWIWIIEQGPAQLFMWIMGPLITIGTYLSDLILNSVATASGAQLPDTCAAIHNYVAAHHTNITIIDANQTANLLCVPTRLSGFFYTAVAAGWKWMLAGIGHSALTFLAGVVFVVIFIYNIWKFALMALGVIVDLFLVLMMLPFTAIAETFNEKDNSKYEGGAKIPGDIFKAFMGIFSVKNFSLNAAVMKFINVAVYFVSLSIVIALCAAILSGVVDADLSATVPTLDNNGFMTVLIVGCLVAYLASKSDTIAKDIGGSIENGEFSKNLQSDIKKLYDNTIKTGKSWAKAFNKKK